jgi:integrase
MAGSTRRRPFARHLGRVRKLCLALPDTFEKLSHGEPTFFVRKRVFAMFSNDHHHDGHVSVLLAAPPGLQEALIEEMPLAYYRPPYVGGSLRTVAELLGHQTMQMTMRYAHLSAGYLSNEIKLLDGIGCPRRAKKGQRRPQHDATQAKAGKF